MGRLTDVSVTVRQIREKSIAVADGTTHMHPDGKGGEIERETWFFLPLSVIEVDPPEYEVGDTVTVTLPESMAQEKELL